MDNQQVSTYRTYAARSRGRREHVLVGLMTAFRAANTSFMSYTSPLCINPDLQLVKQEEAQVVLQAELEESLEVVQELPEEAGHLHPAHSVGLEPHS